VFIIINRMEVPEEHRERFEEVFKTRAHAVDRRPGFISAQILRPTEGNTYIVMTRWESEDNFNEWVNSPEFIEGHRRRDEFKNAEGHFALKSKVERYEVFAE